MILIFLALISLPFIIGSMQKGSSRTLADTMGNLALVLPAGVHTVALQWRSLVPGVDWQTLAGLADGYSTGEVTLREN